MILSKSPGEWAPAPDETPHSSPTLPTEWMEWLERPPSSLPNYLVAQFNQRTYFLVVLSKARTRHHGVCVVVRHHGVCMVIKHHGLCVVISYSLGTVQTLHFLLFSSTALTVMFLAWLDTLYQAMNSRLAQALPRGLAPSPISAELYWADGTVPVWRCQDMTATCHGQPCHKANQPNPLLVSASLS